MDKKFTLIGLFFFISVSIFSQVPFHKGVNLTGWFQANTARQIQFSKFTRQDFVNIKGMGCDVVRLPINLHAMTAGSPNYVVDPLLFSFLDNVVNWAEELQIYLLLDNHSFDPSANTDPNVGTVLTKVWAQMATHFKDRSNYILYEVLNEPHGIAAATWGQIQQTAIDAIRTVDTKHTIVVGGVNFNNYNDLSTLPVYTDKNLLYTFHFYDPFVFTHQGASWNTPSMEPLSGVPFPYNASKMPACPTSLKGSWVESSLNNYAADGTVAKVKSLIDIAANFKTTRNVNVFCGEFGVYIPNSSNDDRTYWYEVVRKYLEEKGIPWTIWDYTGTFGIFNKGSNEIFDYDVNLPLVAALGLTQPAQKVYTLRPDSVGFDLYTDYQGEKINDASYTSSGTLDFYSETAVKEGKYAIAWTNIGQYSQICFDFKPNKDLSKLKDLNYVLDFWVKGNVAGASFDIRFIDTKTDASDHPWRMKFTVDKSLATWDNAWHHIQIPLKNFTEGGAWENNTWYNAENKFDWKAVDKIEIVAEYTTLTSAQVYFDNLKIIDPATTGFEDDKGIPTKADLHIYPNPWSSSAAIYLQNWGNDKADIAIYNLNGQKVAGLYNGAVKSELLTINWNGLGADGKPLAAGLYVCRVVGKGKAITAKLLKQ
jgi:endoglucanase